MTLEVSVMTGFYKVKICIKNLQVIALFRFYLPRCRLPKPQYVIWAYLFIRITNGIIKLFSLIALLGDLFYLYKIDRGLETAYLIF